MVKKFLSAILMVLTIFIFTACGTAEKDSSGGKDSAQAAQPADKILVAYFSCTGNTKNVAEDVAEILNADIFEIVPSQPYTPDDLDYNVENCRANLEQNDSAARPEIKNQIENIAQYKAIVIAFPIWWGAEPRIIDTFVESYDLGGKIIVPVCTSGGSDINVAVKNLQDMCKGSQVTDGKRLGIISKDEVKVWLDTLKL